MAPHDETVQFFSFKPKDRPQHYLIKWTATHTADDGTVTTRRIEATLPFLDSIEIEDLLLHCARVRNGILNAVDESRFDISSVYAAFPRTLSAVLNTQWVTALGQPVDGNMVDPGDRTLDTFDAHVRYLVLNYMTEAESETAKQQLTMARKKRDVDCTTHGYLLQEYSNALKFAPEGQPLSQTALVRAYYDSMPAAWKQRFVSSGQSLGDQTLPDVIRYFRNQERLAQLKEADNIAKQRRAKKNNRDKKGRTGKSGGSYKAQVNAAQHGKANGKNNGSKRIRDDASCPVHPGANHTWGECNANAFRKKSKSSDGHVAEGNDNDDKSTASEGEVNVSEMLNDIDVLAINDVDVDFSGASIDCLATDTPEPTTHHFDSLSPLNLFQVEATNDGERIVLTDNFTSHIEEIHSQGDSDIKLLGSELNMTRSIRNRSLGLMTGLVHGHKVKKPLKVLFDTGSDRTMINSKALPKGVTPMKKRDPENINGIHGAKVLDREVLLQGMIFPEFTSSIKIPGPARATVFDNKNSQHDIILGMDLMQPIGFNIDCEKRQITFQGHEVPFRPADYFSSGAFTASTLVDEKDDPFAEEAGYRSKVILHSKYEETDPIKVALDQKHLSLPKRNALATMFGKFKKLFSNKLGVFPNKKIHLDLVDGAKPVTCRPYPVPRSHEKVFKDELDRLCKEGVLTPTGVSQWLSPSFIIPKKDGRVRWISDFRALNKVIKRKVYNLPKITSILQKRSGYKYFTKIDVSMHYYTFELDDESKELCTICTPFGNYRYNRLPMGISESPDIAQSVMEELFRPIEEAEVYIDDVGIFSNDWESHIRVVEKALKILQDHNFMVSPLKCEWAVQETDWLGYWLTPQGLRPWQKKIKAILAIERPKTGKQLRSFIGAVNFYRDMYPRRSHILAPLTSMSSKKGNIPWDDNCEKAFKQMKALLAQDVMLRYPDHNKPFHIYTDASDYQLGAVIMQEKMPVAYYSRKLNSAQRNYTVGEKELLSVVEVLKEFHTMLYGCQNIHVYTDHKNNTFQRLQTQRVIRWRLYLEEYGVQFHYIKGENNDLADALSRLPFSEEHNQHDSPETALVEYNNEDPNTTDDSHYAHIYSMALENGVLADCLSTLPISEGLPFQLDFGTIRTAQTGDAHLQQLRNDHPDIYQEKLLAPDMRVICYVPRDQNSPWKIYLPTALLQPTIEWYHSALGHIGRDRLIDSIKQVFFHPDITARVTGHVAGCEICSKEKPVGPGYGHLPGREVNGHPWREVAIDTIGPWPLVVDGQRIEFRALTIVDTVTNLAEVVRVENMQARHIAMLFHNHWLCRHPRPTRVIFDQGTEFQGNFLQALNHYQIQASPIGTKNPQANGICERMHVSITNTLRVYENIDPPQGLQAAHHIVDTAIANAVFAVRATFHGALKASPGSLAFARDMVHDIPFLADWQLIRQRRQQLVDERLIRENAKRFSYDYAVGDQVLKKVDKPGKLTARFTGPFPIETVHTNGTVTIRISPTAIERINIRRIKPLQR